MSILRIRTDLGLYRAITFMAVVILSLFVVCALPREPSVPEPASMPIVIEAGGFVRNPGVYLLKGPRATVGEAIEASGGWARGGEWGVPEEDLHREIFTGQVLMVSPTDSKTLKIELKPMEAAARLTLGGRLDLNTATEAELCLVPQMKGEFATAIVNRRNRKPWHSVGELQEIWGVGPRSVEKWADYLVAEGR